MRDDTIDPSIGDMETYQYRRRTWFRWNAALMAAAVMLLGAAGCRSAGPFALTGDAAPAPPPDSTLAHTVFVIGDAGRPAYERQEPSLKLLQSYLADAGERSAVVFVGDNLYPSGLPPAGAPTRAAAERRLMAQLDVVADYPGRVVFIPGNHDWGGAGLGGSPETVRRQERFVEAVLDRGNTFLPDRGFPGPVEVPLTDDLTLVVIDTQWWLEPVKPYGDTGQYLLEQEGEFLLALDDALRRHADRHVLVAGHHPLFTNGTHGGRFPADDRLIPLQWLSRAYLGTPQDLSNYKYRRLRDGLLAVLSEHDGLVYVAGHEHNLQYFPHREQHYVVSGAGSKTDYVEPGRGAAFVDEGKGFAALKYYTDGSVWLSFWKPEGDGAQGRLLYRARLEEGTRPLVAARDTVTSGASPAVLAATEEAPVPEAADASAVDAGSDGHAGPPEAALDETEPYAFVGSGTVTAQAGKRYGVSRFKEMVLGRHYRDVWDLPVEVEVLDMEHTAGGLTPIKRGGGFQTAALRLQGADGDQYVLRSIDKDPTSTVPPYLHDTIAHDVVRDQISAMHPYAAFAVPRLADAAGVYHTQPRLVVVPDDPRLGIYRKEFAGMLALFETRPDEDQSDEARFGRAPDVIGSPRLMEKLEEDNDQRVDERAFARARLFDMLLGDWDRHSDQWRWAEFEPYQLDPTLEGDARTQGKVYRPIPRDRDFAFFKFDGPLARLARLSGSVAFRRLTDFSKGYHDIFGLNFQGAALDRRFTASLTREDWVALAEDVRTRLTDEVIEAAVRDMPPPVVDYHGDDLVALLKRRRDALPDAAAAYYPYLAKIVDVVGSDKHERFEVHRLDDARTEVVVYKTKKEGDVVTERFRRVFSHDETEEVRLYGRGGNDQFVVSGRVGESLLVRAIGGADEDVFVDSSEVTGSAQRTRFYDGVEGDTWDLGDEAVAFRSDAPDHNTYTMLRFERDVVAPVLTLSRNADEGVRLGGGVRYEEHAFRRVPFAASHEFRAHYATRTGTFGGRYEGVVTDFAGAWDGHLTAMGQQAQRFNDFYGLGNETRLSDRPHYRAAVGRISVAPALQRRQWPFQTWRLGARVAMVSVEEPEGFDPAFNRFSSSDFVDKYYAGLEGAFHIDGTDTLANTRSGLRWLNEARAVLGVRHTRAFHVNLASELAYFYTFDLPSQVTLALRAGGAANIGHFAFFHANTLGGGRNLRGYRTTRFAGRHAFYTNAELRAKLTDFNLYLAKGDLGALAFLDNGRVWADGEDSGLWHQGYGAGLWLSPFHRLVITATVARSRENTLFDVSTGFLF